MKVLHVSHSSACRADLDYVAYSREFKLDHHVYRGGYDLTKEKAEEEWQKKRDQVFNKYDVIITSDAPSLSRIFLQHRDEWKFRLVIWVCNRFDYTGPETAGAGFPDADYYRLFREAADSSDIHVISYTDFERIYAREAWEIELSERTIKPHGRRLPPHHQVIAADEKCGSLFVPPYHNDKKFLTPDITESLGLRTWRGQYQGPRDLNHFKGVLHIPYAWSSIAFFESMWEDLVYFIPSKQFLLELSQQDGFFWSPPFKAEHLEASEWYDPEHEKLVMYFDSWSHLTFMANELGLIRERKAAIKDFRELHLQRTLDNWSEVLAQ